ncbi:uncharacterized protein V1516DRAFT_662716 [Lipomyces oligophaga]|uniref:uncharacterized protein n=1 Tax=Lipomyces oligophaga TaxID=45792 RepID=UPI0034CE8C88
MASTSADRSTSVVIVIGKHLVPERETPATEHNMRDVNFFSVLNNKAAATMTPTMYDRRALDCPLDRPLINSLSSLCMLVSSSQVIRESLATDGGIDRLVAILRSCKGMHAIDQLVSWKWSLSLQCLSAVSVRGSETVRRRVVEAEIVPVLATVLDNFLEAIEKLRLYRDFFVRQSAHNHTSSASSSISHIPATATTTATPATAAFGTAAPVQALATSPAPVQQLIVDEINNNNDNSNDGRNYNISENNQRHLQINGESGAVSDFSLDSAANRTRRGSRDVADSSLFDSASDTNAASIFVSLVGNASANVAATNATAISSGVEEASLGGTETAGETDVETVADTADTPASSISTASTSTSTNYLDRHYSLFQSHRHHHHHHHRHHHSHSHVNHSTSPPNDTSTAPAQVSSATSSINVSVPNNETIPLLSDLDSVQTSFVDPNAMDVDDPQSVTGDSVDAESVVQIDSDEQASSIDVVFAESASYTSNDNSAPSLSDSQMIDIEYASDANQDSHRGNEDSTESLFNSAHATDLDISVENDGSSNGINSSSNRSPFFGQSSPAQAGVLPASPTNIGSPNVVVHASETLQRSPVGPGAVAGANAAVVTGHTADLVAGASPSSSVFNAFPSQENLPREEDVLMCLQLLAYVSKYVYLRPYFQKTHLVPELSIRPELHSDRTEDGVKSETGSVDCDVELKPTDSSVLADEYKMPTLNLFQLVERFTTRTYIGDLHYWASVIMRNSCRKDESRGGVRQCGYFECGKWEEFPKQFAKCRRCRRTKYCSKACQSKAWSFHRHWCVPPDQ